MQYTIYEQMLKLLNQAWYLLIIWTMIPLKSPKLVSHHTVLGTVQRKQKVFPWYKYIGNISVGKRE